jgi:hypothetical protein
MIDVRVGEHNRIDRRRIDGKATPVAAPFLVLTLEHSAVDEHPRRRGFNEVPRARDGACRTEERESCYCERASM